MLINLKNLMQSKEIAPSVKRINKRDRANSDGE
jgi:hypothetical protein